MDGNVILPSTIKDMIKNNNGNGNNNEKIRKVLFNEVSFFLAGIGIISSLMFWVMNPQQEMKLDLVRMQSQLESNQTITTELRNIKDNDLNEIQLRLDRIESRQIESLKSLATLENLYKIKSK